MTTQTTAISIIPINHTKENTHVTISPEIARLFRVSLPLWHAFCTKCCWQDTRGFEARNEIEALMNVKKRENACNCPSHRLRVVPVPSHPSDLLDL